ncbi:MAG TPA: cupin domain-containing protein, partial [Candidatus Baltobacteraceae bacterium]|nr:cupin domain-containing protein [Candidatus Baltobacteraceae bacterium]
DEPDEVRRFDKGTIDVIKVGEHTVGRATFHPGWSWSECVRPIAQTPLCEVEHFGYVTQGRMTVRMQDGTEIEFKAGDVMAVKPNHDAWVLGDQPCVVIDWAGATAYARK